MSATAFETITRPAWATEVDQDGGVLDTEFRRPLAPVVTMERTIIDGVRDTPGEITTNLSIRRSALDSDPVMVTAWGLSADFFDIEDVRRLGEGLLAAYAEAVAVLDGAK